MVAVLGLLLAAPAAAESVRVIDGDGLRIGGQSIRLWGIDAPELRQTCSQAGKPYPCGERARDALKAALGGAVPLCQVIERDRFGRSVAWCSANGHDLAARMVAEGWALDWPRYSGGAYDAQQEAAKQAGRGLWAGFFSAPWDWRKR